MVVQPRGAVGQAVLDLLIGLAVYEVWGHLTILYFCAGSASAWLTLAMRARR
jgi:hypothetical protein